ncbi:hypothetical protein RclHR1_00390007 [Rhizophagus clarus]|uniref:Uncharacterized protein n=1 Tax=Rhizophagus clarus TaxID=94130 RepID=A0A2Z6RHH5_9GLOM|nr:hypothetical protein RclHR1_00390007 [Rhizophagus clarus]
MHVMISTAFKIGITENHMLPATPHISFSGKIYRIVFEAGPDSRFKKLAPRLEIGRLVFITGILDLDNVKIPFVEAKEIDLSDDLNLKIIYLLKKKISDNEIAGYKNDEQISTDDAKMLIIMKRGSLK